MRMNQFKHMNLLCLLIVMFLFACGDDSLIEVSDTPKIETHIFVVPESFSNDVFKYYSSKDTVEVDVNQKIKFIAALSVNGMLENIEASKAFDNVEMQWTIGQEKTSKVTVPYTYTKPSIHTIYLEAKDLFGDSTRDSVVVLVNTPASIALKSPYDKYNLVDPENEDGLELQWDANGIDEWEKASCTVYISYEKENVWNNSLGTIPCEQGATLAGPLISPDDSKDYSYTFYWGVTMNTHSNIGTTEQVSSEIFSFTTTFPNKKKSKLIIPVLLKSHHNNTPSLLEINILNNIGNTIATLHGNGMDRETFEKKIDPQSNVKIVVCDMGTTEYGCDSVIVDALPQATTFLDTIKLFDRTRPGLAPLKTKISPTDSISFLALDNGSGIDQSSIKVLIDQKILDVNFEDDILTFPNTCKSSCEISIELEDFAGNKNANLFWKISTKKKSAIIEGPFFRMEAE